MKTAFKNDIQPDSLKDMWTRAGFEVLLGLTLSYAKYRTQAYIEPWSLLAPIAILAICNFRTLIFSFYSRIAFLSALFILLIISLIDRKTDLSIDFAFLWKDYLSIKAIFILLASSSRGNRKIEPMFERWIKMPEGVLWIGLLYLIAICLDFGSRYFE